MPKLKQCAVVNCLSQNEPNVNFFSFPRNFERCQQWISFCSNNYLSGLSLKNLNTHYFVCSLHFKNEDFVSHLKSSLIRNAVPTTAKPMSDSVSSQSEVLGQPTSSFVTPQVKSYNTLNYLEDQDLGKPPNKRPKLDNNKTVPREDTISSCNTNLEILQYDNLSQSKSPPLSPTILDLNQEFETGYTEELDNSSRKTKKFLNSPKKKELLKLVRQKVKALKRLKKTYIERKLDSNYTIKDIRNITAIDYKKMCTVSSSISDKLKTFLLAQLRCTGKKPHGRRWTSEEKLMALSIYKKGPKVYRFLRHIFTLPCKRTLTSILNGFPFECGINDDMFDALRTSTSKLTIRDKMCCLVFDEISIAKHLSYNIVNDRIDGLEDHGGQGDTGRTKEVASHALVFMITGLIKKYKQPVAYFYSSKKGVSPRLLVNHIKSVINACKKADFNVVATVCDLGGSNIKALKILGASRNNPSFTLEGEEIISIFDPSHLVKCTRNMLEKHEVESTAKSGQLAYVGSGKATWKDIEKCYQLDKSAPGPFRCMWKLTEKHLNPKFRQKLKVKLATQVLSHTVSSTIMKDVSLGALNASAMATAYFVEVSDQLFDSFNGTKKKNSHGKKLKCWLTKSSPHLKFWEEVVPIVDGWQFLSETGKIIRPWSQDGWIWSINGMKRLFNNVTERSTSTESIYYIVPRHISQDPLENMFGSLRSNCGNNSTPNVQQFVGALKTCIINNFAYEDVIQGSNCLNDNTSLLSSLEALLNSKPVKVSTSSNPSNVNNNDQSLVVSAYSFNDVTSIPSDLTATAYVSGFIAKHILDKNDCVNCKLGILSSNPYESHCLGLIFREYNNDKETLTYPSKLLAETIGQCATLLENVLKINFHKKNILELVSKIILKEISFSWFDCFCAEHSSRVSNLIVYGVCRIGIPWWCKKFNRTLMYN